MTFNYAATAATADRLLKRFGTTLSFERDSEPEYDPGTGNAASTLLEWTAIAAILPASKGTIEAFDVRLENGTLIESKLRALLISAVSSVRMPVPGDRVLFPDGKKGVFLGCTPLNVDGRTPVIYQGTVKI